MPELCTVVMARTPAAKGAVYCGRHRVKGGEVRHMLNTPIGRRGWLGNLNEGPFALAYFGTDFYARIHTEPDFKAAVLALAGKPLACFCGEWDGRSETGLRCHAVVIARFVNGEVQGG